MTALQIYLDSSDYSNFCNPARESQLTTIRRQLDSWVHDGTVEVRYSWSHVVELMHTEQKYLPAAKARAAALTSICKGRTLLYLTDLFSREAVNAIVPRTYAAPTFAFDECDRYFPQGTVEAEDFKNFPLTTLLEAAARLPRNQRRLMKRRFMDRGQLSAAGTRFVREVLLSQTSIPAEGDANGDWVSSGRLQQILYAGGPNQSDEFAREVFQPERLVSMYIDATPSGDALRQTIRRPAAKLVASMDTLRAALSKMATLVPEGVPGFQQAALRTFQAIRHSLIESLMEQDSGPLRDRGLGVGEALDLLVASPQGSLPSLDLMLGAAESWAKTAIKDPRRNLKASDFGDMTHAAYIPYVDFWRGDKYMTHELRALGHRYNCTVVASLEELVDAVRFRLGSRT